MDYKVLIALIASTIDVVYIEAKMVRGHSPFFWQPKLIITLVTPKKKVDTNQMVMLRGYKLGITMMALVEGLPERHKLSYLNPMETAFYTDAYRWYLRHMSLIPLWFYGENGNYAETIKIWKSRFMYADSFLPPWMQRMLLHIPAYKWREEREQFATFTKYAGATYARQLRYNQGNKSKPAIKWYASHESADSVEPPEEITTLGPYVSNITSPVFSDERSGLPDPHPDWPPSDNFTGMLGLVSPSDSSSVRPTQDSPGKPALNPGYYPVGLHIDQLDRIVNDRVQKQLAESDGLGYLKITEPPLMSQGAIEWPVGDVPSWPLTAESPGSPSVSDVIAGVPADKLAQTQDSEKHDYPPIRRTRWDSNQYSASGDVRPRVLIPLLLFFLALKYLANPSIRLE